MRAVGIPYDCGREREMRGGRDSGEVRATRRDGGGEEDVRAVLSSLVQMDLNYPFFFIQ